MAFWCIDPVDGNDGTGSSQATQAAAELTPFQNWSAITWAAGDTYLQKSGTTYNGGILITATGTAGNIITLGKYGGSDYAYIVSASANGLFGNAREYVSVSGFSVTAPNNGGIGFLVTSTRSRGLTIKDCIAHDCGFTGVGISASPGQSSYQTMEDNLIENCVAYNNGSHGVNMVGQLTSSCIIKDCTAYNNGLSNNAWGIYMSSRSSKHNGGGWTNVAGTVYSLDVYARTALLSPEVIVEVAASGRTGAGVTNPVHLTEGTYGALALNEWAQLGALVQIDIGEDPTNKSIVFGSTITTGGQIINPTAHSHSSLAADGTGVGFDHMMNGGLIIGGRSYDNDLSGYGLNVCRNCYIIGAEAYGNFNGAGFASNDDNGEDVYIVNCYLHDNTSTGMRCFRAGAGHFISNAVEDNDINFDINDSSTVTYTNNNYFGNTTTQNTDVSDTTGDPLRNADGTVQSGSPLVGTGVKWWTGANPVGNDGEPFSSFDIDKGHIQSTFGPFHPKNL